MPGPVEAPQTVMQQISSILEKSILKEFESKEKKQSLDKAKIYCLGNK